MKRLIDLKLSQAIDIIRQLGMPSAQQNDRSALCLLALLSLSPSDDWSEASSRLIGITPIMEWAKREYQRDYKPNTRETFRRQSMHQFVEAGIALYYPDDPGRPVNSPKAVYSISPDVLALVRKYGTPGWDREVESYFDNHDRLTDKYARSRNLEKIPVKLIGEQSFYLTPGSHSVLIKAIIEEFAPRFIPGSELIYVGDTGSKYGYFNTPLLSSLGVVIDSHGKMPDVIFYYKDKQWLVLVESVTSHGPIDGKRYFELRDLFQSSIAPLVYVTAFPDRSIMAKYLNTIAWESEVWIADNPSHLIHFNGTKFLGPYTTQDDI